MTDPYAVFIQSRCPGRLVPFARSVSALPLSRAQAGAATRRAAPRLPPAGRALASQATACCAVRGASFEPAVFFPPNRAPRSAGAGFCRIASGTDLTLVTSTRGWMLRTPSVSEMLHRAHSAASAR